MSQFDEHTHQSPQGKGNPAWQRVFDEAAETPPPRVWDAIERELNDKQDDRVLVIPFWGRPTTWVWSAAAVLALLLGGWWSLRPSDPVASPQLATKQLLVQEKPTVASTDIPRVTQSIPDKSTAVSSSDEASVEPQPFAAHVRQPEVGNSNNLPSGSLFNESKPQSLAGLTMKQADAQKPQALAGELAQQKSNPLNTQQIADASGTQQIADASETAPADRQSIASLQTLPMRLPSMYGTQRIVWFGKTELTSDPTSEKTRKDKSEHWASVSVMPSSFNPGVGLQPSGVAYSNSADQLNASSYRSSQAGPSLVSQPQLSVAYQLSTGLQLGNRWSVEAGVGYLEARSLVDSPVQSIVSSMLPAGRLSNLYADALYNSRTSENQTPPPSTVVTPGGVPSATPQYGQLINTNVYNISRSQTLSNDYTFVQLPVQLGYQLRPHKRFGLTVLGGLLTNLFVRNTVNEQLSVTNSDGIYRPITLSASTGLRMRYRPTRRWSASMAGIFQQALQRGTRVGTDLITRPQTMGVSVGVDYHF